MAFALQMSAFDPKRTFCLCAVVGYFNRKSFFFVIDDTAKSDD